MPKGKKKAALTALGGALLIAAVAMIKGFPEWFYNKLKAEPPRPTINVIVTNGMGVGENSGSIHYIQQQITMVTNPPKALPIGISLQPNSNGYGPITVKSFDTGFSKQYYCFPDTKSGALYDAVLGDFGYQDQFNLNSPHTYTAHWVFVDSNVMAEFNKLSMDDQTKMRMYLADSQGKVHIIKASDLKNNISACSLVLSHTLLLIPAFDRGTYARIQMDMESDQKDWLREQEKHGLHQVGGQYQQWSPENHETSTNRKWWQFP